MRFLLLALLLPLGCGSVRLGEEEPPDGTNFDAASGLDAGELEVVVTIAVPDAGCTPCVELTAAGSRGTPPYRFEWDDGSTEAHRSVCAPVSQDTFTVIARDARGRSSAPHPLRVDLRDKVCPQPKVLCLENPSFEGTPQLNTGGVFDARPWSDCTNPARPNLPNVTNDTIQQWVTKLPDPTNGETYLALQEAMQVSQPLCAPIASGEQRAFRIDARKLDISSATLDNSEQIFLSVWGGESASCATQNLLWASPALGSAGWQSFCVTIAPSQYVDRLILKAITDQSQLATSVLIADNIVPVPSCP